MIRTKYLFGSFLALPFLPLMYLQGQRIKASVPRLPAARGTEGTAGPGDSPVLRLLTLGESTIAGVGVKTHEEGFTGALAGDLARSLSAAVHWKVYARSGYTAKRVQEKIIPLITKSSADLIVVGLGGNDAFTLNTPWKWRTHIQHLIDGIRSKFPRTPIVFANMPPIKEFPAFTPLIKRTVGNLVEVLGAELEVLTRDQPGVYYHSEIITLKDWVEKLNIDASPADFFSDGVHPSKLTYQVWAKDLSEFIMEQDEIKTGLLQKIGAS